MLDGFWEWSGDLVSNTVNGAIDIGKELATNNQTDQNSGGNPTVADQVTTATPTPAPTDNTKLYLGAGLGFAFLLVLVVFGLKGGK